MSILMALLAELTKNQMGIMNLFMLTTNRHIMKEQNVLKIIINEINTQI